MSHNRHPLITDLLSIMWTSMTARGRGYARQSTRGHIGTGEDRRADKLEAHAKYGSQLLRRYARRYT